MNPKDKQRLKEIKQLASQLESGKSTEILKALEILPEKGAREHIALLLQLLETSSDETIKNKVLNLLHNIKVSGAKHYVMQALRRAQNETYKQQLLSIIWNAGIDVSDQLEKIINILIEGDYLTSIEAHTVIEECMNEIKDKEEVEKSIKRLKQAVVANAQSEKAELLIGVIHSLNQKLSE